MAPSTIDKGILDFHDRLHGLTSPDQCEALFRETVAPFGFDTFASGELNVANRSHSAFHIIGWPASWRRFYLDSGLIERDPIVGELERRTRAFTWSDLRADRTLSQMGTQALDEIRAAGWSEGLVVPLRQSSCRIGLVSLAGHRDCRDRDERRYLTLISSCLYYHVRTLVARCGFAVPPAGLTDRELDCVRLVAQGKSDHTIAQALKIADSTAHEHVERAKQRLGVHSRAQLSAIAVSLAIVDL